MAVQRFRLTVVDRTIIELRRRDGCSIRMIARELGRSPGTVCDEIKRHGKVAGYRAAKAEADAAAGRGRSGRKLRLAPDGPLFAGIARLLRLGWSPEQISGRRKRMENGMEQPSGLRVSHEAIYTALYALPRGELRRELLSFLRQAKPMRGRRPKGSGRRGKLVGMTNIRERPEEVGGRLVPGHWEGDLILGAGGASAVGTLVERTTRLVVLVHMAARKADVAASAFAGALNAIPAPLRKTLTYDQGKEMAGHEGLAAQTGMRIFFADPHSPWQRGSNENTNGLLRQYLPKGSSLASLDQDDLDIVAASLNDRPRKTLDYATPNEAFNSLLATLAGGSETQNGGGVRYEC
ncbi:MAG: IS30 family transposase [Betaproteobacteria bacterium]|nr:IS30 family transposase [Betaproteobacteria bacterium]